MKGIIAISLILLAGLASAYTTEQQTALDTMNLGIKLGMAYEKASQGQNIAEYNALVDEYNAWVRQLFGEDTSLFKSKIGGTGNQYLTKPFNASSPLSTFGKQQAYAAPLTAGETNSESDISRQNLENFLHT